MEILNRKTILIDDIEIDIDKIPDNSLDISQYKKIRATIDGWRSLLPKMTNETLEHHVSEFKRNSTVPKHSTAPTYDVTLINYIIPELIRRVKLKEELISEH